MDTITENYVEPKRTERSRSYRKIFETAFLISIFFATANLVIMLVHPHMRHGLYVSSFSKNYGSVSQGTILQSSFTVRNLSFQPITIYGILPGCGCTSATIKGHAVPYTISPFQTADILLTVNTTGFNEKIDKLASVCLDQNHSQYFNLEVAAIVAPKAR